VGLLLDSSKVVSRSVEGFTASYNIVLIGGEEVVEEVFLPRAGLGKVVHGCVWTYRGIWRLKDRLGLQETVFGEGSESLRNWS